MKFLFQLLTVGFFLVDLQAINFQNTPKLNVFSMFIDTDYQPTAHAFSGVKYIQSEYQTFKEQVAKNTSIEYVKCVNFINMQKCNNIDQWQSVIEELKLENSNSIQIEVPFLQEKKEEKIESLKQLLSISEEYDNKLVKIAKLLSEHKNELIESSRQITVMYKLPEQKDKSSFVERQDNDPASTLNADVPDVAHEELAKAKEQFDIADQSIQAQTAQNVLDSASEKIVETLEHLQKAFEQKIADLRAEKKLLKGDILRLRALLANEQAIQQRNTQKIADMEQLVDGCKGRPTNIEKDCEPIKLRAAKLYTEIDIVNSRTLVLTKELELLMRDNINADQVLKENEKQQRLQEQLKSERQEELSYLLDENNITNQSYVPNEPRELRPIHHLPGVNGIEEQKKPMNEIVPENTQNETNTTV